MTPPYRLAGHQRPTPEQRKRWQQTVPYAQAEPLIGELEARFPDEGLNQIFRVVGYASKPQKAAWIKYGVPTVAYNAIKGVLADLAIDKAVRETMDAAAQPEVSGLLTEPEPEPEPEPQPESLNGEADDKADFDLRCALFGLLAYGIPMREDQRRILLKRLAAELARDD